MKEFRKKRFVIFIDEQRLFAPQQFGIQKNHYCVHALVSLTELMRQCLDKNWAGLAYFDDLKKQRNRSHHFGAEI